MFKKRFCVDREGYTEKKLEPKRFPRHGAVLENGATLAGGAVRLNLFYK